MTRDDNVKIQVDSQAGQQLWVGNGVDGQKPQCCRGCGGIGKRRLINWCGRGLVMLRKMGEE